MSESDWGAWSFVTMVVLVMLIIASCTVLTTKSNIESTKSISFIEKCTDNCFFIPCWEKCQELFGNKTCERDAR